MVSTVTKKDIGVVTVSLLIVLSYPITLPLYLIILVYRQLVWLIIKRDNQMKKIMSSLDTIISLPSPYNNPSMVLLATYPLSSSVDIGHIKRHLENVLINASYSDGSLKFPELKQRIVFKWGYAFCRQVDSFSVDNHVKYLCPEDPFKTIDRHELHQIIPTVTASNFNPDWSPWEMLIVPNFVDPEDLSVKSLFMLRISHCICDGLALVSLANHLTIHPQKSTQNPNYVAVTWNPMKFALSFGYLLYALMKGPYVVMKHLVNQSDTNRNPLVEAVKMQTSKQKLIYIESKSISTAQLKPIQTYCNVRSATVLIGIYVEVILDSMKMKNISLPKEMDLILPGPIPNHPETLTNHFIAEKMTVKICTSNPLQTLKNIEAAYAQFRDSDAPQIIDYVIKHLLKLPLTFVQNKQVGLDNTGALSNFRYAVKPVDLFGYDVKSVGLCSIAPPQPFAFGCVGHVGNVKYTGTVDATIFNEQNAHAIKAKLDTQVNTYLNLVSKKCY